MELIKILMNLCSRPQIIACQEIAIKKQFEKGDLNPQEIVDNYKKLSWKERNFSFDCGTKYLRYAVAKNYLNQ